MAARAETGFRLRGNDVEAGAGVRLARFVIPAGAGILFF
jgi:hypothetical protein